MRTSLFAAALGCALMAMAAGPENKTCPVSGKAVDKSVTSTIKRNVGFC